MKTKRGRLSRGGNAGPNAGLLISGNFAGDFGKKFYSVW